LAWDTHGVKQLLVGLFGGNKTPGLEQVSISQARSLSVLALDDMQEELMYDQLMSIGTGKAYDK
jgi:hypothetical protein